MDSFVLLSRISPPRIASSFMHKPILTDSLSRGLASVPAITFIIAPPGYGKTVLAASWANSCDSYAWYTLGKRDNILPQFVHCLSASIKLNNPEFGKDISDLLKSPIQKSPEFFSEVFAYEIEKISKPISIIIDNYHEIDDEDILNFMTGLLDNLPLNIHLVLISQEDPPFSVARRRLTQNIFEIRQSDLAFKNDEVKNLLHSSFMIDLDDAYIDKITQKTEGWPAAVSLSALSLSKISAEQRPDAVDTSFNSYNYIIDYFTDFIIRDFEQSILDFVIDTVLLESFTPELADFVRESEDSAALLGLLQLKHLPVLTQENNHNWFRYHTLFSEYIKSKYKSNRESKILLRASAWFEQHHGIPAALKYAVLSGNTARIEFLVEKESERLFLSGKFAVIDKMIGDTEPRILQNPVIFSIKIWSDFLNGKDISIEETGRFPSDNEDDDGNTQFIVKCLKSWILFGNDSSLSLEYAEECMRHKDDMNVFFNCMSRLIYGKNLYSISRIIEAEKVFADLEKFLDGTDFTFLYYAVVNNLLYAIAANGKYAYALEKGQIVLNRKVTENISNPEKSMVLLAMARVFYLKKDCDQAREYMNTSIPFLKLVEAEKFIVENEKSLLNDLEKTAEKEKTNDSGNKPAVQFHETISRREQEILELIADGHSNIEIGNLLFINVGTVKWHLNNIFSKLIVKNRMQAILKARQLKIIK